MWHHRASLQHDIALIASCWPLVSISMGLKTAIEECFPKLTQPTFWPNWVKHNICHLSKTHSPTSPNTHPLAPQHTPSHTQWPPESIQTSLTHPQTHQHHHHHHALTHWSHTQWLPWKQLSKTHSVQFTLCIIWIGTNLDFSEFEKLTGFQGIHFVLSLGFIFFFFLCIISHF